MPKNLEEKFIHYCNSENLEINSNQVSVIKELQDYYKRILDHQFLISFQKKISRKGSIYMEMLVLEKL